MTNDQLISTSTFSMFEIHVTSSLHLCYISTNFSGFHLFIRYLFLCSLFISYHLVILCLCVCCLQSPSIYLHSVQLLLYSFFSILLVLESTQLFLPHLPQNFHIFFIPKISISFSYGFIA